MAAETTGDIDAAQDQPGDAQLAVQSDEAFSKLDPETRQRLIDTTTDPVAKARYQKLATGLEQQPVSPDKSTLQRTGDKGDSALTIAAKKEPEKPDIQVPSISPPPEEKPPEATVPSGQIFGRTTIFHYNHDGSRDKEDPGSTGFFGVNLDDPNLVGAAVPVDILEAQFGKFTQKLPDGTYAALNTPEAQEIVKRIKASHVSVQKPDGSTIDVPIVDIQGSYKNWHRTLDLTLGAWNALGFKDDTYLGYSIVSGDGTVMNADASWSDTSPIAKLYQQHGKEFADTYPSDVLRAAKANIAPDMPEEDYDRAMRSPGGKEELAKYKAQPKSPGEQLTAIEGTPYYGLGKDDLTKKVYSDLVKLGKIDPAKVDLSEIGDKLYPNPGIVESLGQLFNWDSSFWTAAKRGASAEAHQLAADIYDIPRNLEEWDKKVYGAIPGVDKLRQKLNNFIEQHLGQPNYFKDLVGYLHGQSEAQRNQAQIDAQRQAQIGTTLPGKIGGISGRVGAGLALQLPMLVPGASIKSAVALAGAYEGITRYGEAAQRGQSDALVQGIEGAGMGGLQRYMMDAPSGRTMTAFITWLAGTGEETLSRMLKGGHVDFTDVVTRSTIDLTTGWLMGQAKEKPRTGLAEGLKTDEQVAAERSALARQVLGPEVSEEAVWHAPSPLVTRPVEREAFTPSELSLAAGELPAGASTSELARRAGLLKPSPEQRQLELHVADPEAGLKAERNTILRAEAQTIQQAKENGDYREALDHGNRALALLNGDELKQMAREQVTLSEKWADNTVTPGTKSTVKLSDTELNMISHSIGLGGLETLEGRPLPLDSTIADHLDVAGTGKNGEAEVSQEGAEFYTGLPIAPVVRATRLGIKALGQMGPIKGIRERMGGMSPEMTAIIRGQRSGAEERMVRLPKEIAHTMRVDDVLRGGEKVARRRDFFARIAKSTQLAMMIAHEKKQPVGHPIGEELFKFHDAVYKAIELREKAAGFKYDPREVYIYHLIKGGKPEQERYKQYYNAQVAANPRFTHSRYFGSLEALHKDGFRLETYNPEELLQRRLFQSEMAINKVMQLREAERAGVAYRTDHPKLDAGIKAWGEPWRAPNGERYYVRPDAQVPLHNAWDLTSLYNDRVWGWPLKTLAMLKGVAMPFKLGWFNFTHARHIGISMNVASSLNSLSQAAIHGKLRGEVFATEFERLAKFGYAHSAEVGVLQGKRSGKGLSLDQKTNIQDFNDAGLSVRISDDTRMSFNSEMRQVLSNQLDRLQVARGTRETVHGAATVLQAGYDIVSSRPIQDYLFHTTIPQIKFSQFLSLRDNLIRNHPELLKPENRFQYKKELSRIGESVEARFGEMFHDNLLWKKTWKDIGTAGLFAFGWNTGAVRIFAGAARDFAALGTKLLEDGHISRDDITDRMTFALWYTAVNMAQFGLINYLGVSFWNAAHPDQKHDPVPDGIDWVMPRVGYDSSGVAKRVAPVEYTREIATIAQHLNDQDFPTVVGEVFRNKMNPILGTLIEEWQNRNFFGQQIRDPNDPWNKKVQDSVLHALQNTLGPISLSAAPIVGEKTGREKSWWDFAAASVGFPQAPGWASRTGIENRIIDTYHETHNSTKQEGATASQSYNALRQAVLAKNPAAQRAAEKTLSDLGVSKSTISYIRNHAHETYAQSAWKKLSAQEQLKILKFMSRDELSQYWPLAHKALRDKFHTEQRALQAP